MPLKGGDNTKAYYGSKLSPNMTMTPEGFLLCLNVPIARTGWMQYLGQEVNREDLSDQPVEVYRSPNEVFAPAAIASFEGKSVTDEHPHQWVSPDNYSSYERGQVMNVRQGTDDESDILLADLIVKDPTLISEIEHGKREVSCGYEHDLIPIDGEENKYQQVKIRGNHVAVVTAGRAGPRVAIKDQKPIERRKSMKNVDRNTLWGKMLSAFAKDAEPEELAEASKMGPGAEKKANDELAAPPVQPPKKDTTATDEGPDPAIAELTQKINTLAGIVTKLVEGQKESQEQKEPKDALDALVGELESPETAQPEQQDPEESVTIDEAPTAPTDELPVNPIPGADRNSILNAIKAVRPVIANIKDAGERKRASDALAKTFRDQLSTLVPQQQPGGYAGILKAQQSTAKNQSKDQQPEDLTQLGKDIAKKFNPHYKEAK